MHGFPTELCFLKTKKEKENFNKKNLNELKKGFYKLKIKRNELKSEINEN